MNQTINLLRRAAGLTVAISLIAACGDIVRPGDNTGGGETQPTVVISTPVAPTEAPTPTARPAGEGVPELPAGVEIVTLASGLQYADIEVGTGEEAKTGDTVAMHYTGYLADGTIFDSNVAPDQPFVTPIGSGMVIQGWELGVPGMKVGGKRRLIIPSELGYGAAGAGGVIPPNADLVFDVELAGIQ